MTWEQYFKSINSYKKAFWLYLVLIFIEGAMRKWFMPGSSNLWYVVREPIVLYIFLGGWSHGWLKSRYAITFMVIACISLLFTMTIGHQNLFVALWGFRIWFMHIPFIFIMARILNREDFMRILKFLIMVFIPMSFLYLAQWFSPTDAWLNKSLGGDEVETTASAATTALQVGSSRLRPSGTFVHCVGSTYYNPIMLCILAASMLSVCYRKYFTPFKGKIFPLFVLCYVVTVVTSGSRSTTIQSIVTILFLAMMLSMYGGRHRFGRLVVMLIGVSVLVYLVAAFKIGGASLIDPLLERFADAAETEGGTEGIVKSRILAGYAFWDGPAVTIFGKGLGLSSNFASQMFTGSYGWALGESAHQQVVGEMGLLLGGLVFFLRIGLEISLFFQCLKILKRKKDVLPMAFWTMSYNAFGNSNHLNITCALGFVCILMILLLTSIKTSTKYVD